MLPTRVHGILDYVVGLFLLGSPWFLDFHQSGTATWVVTVLGGGALLYSVFTDYEAGVVKQIPMPVHLAMDATSGVLLAVSPWLFGFTETTWKPHLILGLLELGVAAISQRQPSYRRALERA